MPAGRFRFVIGIAIDLLFWSIDTTHFSIPRKATSGRLALDFPSHGSELYPSAPKEGARHGSSYRRFVQITVSEETRPEVASLEVSHVTGGPHDGLARLEVAFRDQDPLVLVLGPVAADKLGAGLSAASFDHRAALERWDAEH